MASLPMLVHPHVKSQRFLITSQRGSLALPRDSPRSLRVRLRSFYVYSMERRIRLIFVASVAALFESLATERLWLMRVLHCQTTSGSTLNSRLRSTTRVALNYAWMGSMSQAEVLIQITPVMPVSIGSCSVESSRPALTMISGPTISTFSTALQVQVPILVMTSSET